jgi:hypothetical protein
MVGTVVSIPGRFISQAPSTTDSPDDFIFYRRGTAYRLSESELETRFIERDETLYLSIRDRMTREGTTVDAEELLASD